MLLLLIMIGRIWRKMVRMSPLQDRSPPCRNYSMLLMLLVLVLLMLLLLLVLLLMDIYCR
jgi:hypothetical protein